MRYSATVCLLHVQEPHQGLLPVILIAVVLARGNQTDCVGFQKYLRMHFITSTDDRVRIEENLHVFDLDEIASEYLTGLT